MEVMGEFGIPGRRTFNKRQAKKVSEPIIFRAFKKLVQAR